MNFAVMVEAPFQVGPDSFRQRRSAKVFDDQTTIAHIKAWAMKELNTTNINICDLAFMEVRP